MPHACNIDARGRLFRGIIGLVAVAIGLVALFGWALPTGSALAWVIVAVAAVAGTFGFYQAYHGWCAARAMGFKTSI